MSFHVGMVFNVRMFDAYAAASMALNALIARGFVVLRAAPQRPGMDSLDILEGLFGGPISCVPLVEPPPPLAQPEKVIAARRMRLSAARVDFSVVFIRSVSLGVAVGGRGCRLLFQGFLLLVAARAAFIVAALFAAVAALLAAGAAVFGGLHFRVVLGLRERGGGGEGQGEEGELQGFHGLVFLR